MYRKPHLCILTICLIVVIMTAPSLAEAQEGPCTAEGITVRNATMIDLWYRKDDGTCLIWTHEHLFTINPGERINVFSDLNCQSLYCTSNPTYKDYRSVDANGNCRVKILPKCNLSDM